MKLKIITLLLFVCMTVSVSGQAVDTLTTKSGLRYFFTKNGNGTATKRGWVVVTHYTVWLLNGQKIDSSRGKSEPFGFIMGDSEIIKGTNEALSLMHVGDRGVFIMPYQIAYGKNGFGPVPPKATIVYDIEVLDMLHYSLTDVLNNALFDKTAADQAQPRISKMVDTFKRLQKDGFKEHFINEENLNRFGVSLSAHPDAALEVFKFNVELYPQSSKAYSSLADGYYQLSDTDQAIVNYEKALTLNPSNKAAAEMLKKLKK